MTRKERILARLAELGAEPKRSLGQNFLVSDTVVDRILFAAKSEKFDSLIEVGPGLGALTEDLLTLAKPITLIELDSKFAASWRARAESSDGKIRVVEADALQTDWLGLELEGRALFVSNLPYQISSSIVIERCLEPGGVDRMILMFQKEVAQRLRAFPKTKEYGLLTVIAQTFWEISTVCDASPRDFHPPPNVASRVLMFKRRPSPWPAPTRGRAEKYLAFVKAAFSHRRKLMAGNLPLERGFIESVMAARGLLPTARAEELDPAAFVGLYLACEQGQ